MCYYSNYGELQGKLYRLPLMCHENTDSETGKWEEMFVYSGIASL